MIKLEHTDVYGWEAAIRGMRNPMNSWDKSDSGHKPTYTPSGDKIYPFTIGDNDHDLMMRLAKGGSVHAKYRRMITVTVDITAPLYWWKEFDTYKVGTVANSCSTMHKIHSKPIEIDDFSVEGLAVGEYLIFSQYIRNIEELRQEYLKTEDPYIWRMMIQLLPSSYNQKRTILLNYEVLVGMYRDRKNHKLDCWKDFCKWIETLPYSEVITCG
jgi:hypothetical protein